MRLFTGIALPSEIAEGVSRLIDGLRPSAHLKWTPAYNLHITTKFIGEWPQDRLPELTERLRGLKGSGAIRIKIEGIGWFPNPHNPRILWAGVKAPDSLAKLASLTDETTGELGIPRETKPFSPHLTLARVKDAVPLAPIRQAIAQLPSVDFGSFEADCFSLYESVTGPSGSIYTKLAEVSLTTE